MNANTTRTAAATARKNPARMNMIETQNALYFDGYPTDDATVRTVYKAARARALLWTPSRLTTTDASQLDLRPRGRD